MEDKSAKRPPVAASDSKARERKAKERLSRPPKDRREVTIGPTTGTGPDISVE